jgi:TolA-binding protein
MSVSHSKNQYTLIGCALSLMLCLLFPQSAAARPAAIKKILVQPDPLAVKFHVSGQMPVKVIKVEAKELLVALKDVTLEKDFRIEGAKGSGIENIAVERLAGNVVAVVLTVKEPLNKIQSDFNSSNSVFQVRLGQKKKSPAQPAAKKVQIPKPVVVSPEKSKPAAQASSPKPASAGTPRVDAHAGTTTIESILKARKPKLNTVKQETQKQESIPTPSVYVPPNREKSQFKGDISDLVIKIGMSSCASDPISNAIELLKKSMNVKAYDLMDQYIVQDASACTEEAYFLRAYAFYTSVKKQDYAQMLNAERLFQDALISYPKSDYLPYGYAGIGLIQKELNNISAAEGYFNIIKQGYLEYTGLAEVMYHLAQIYDAKGYQDKAMAYYKQVFEDTEINSYIADAGIGYGKALYNKRQYLDALSVLNYVVDDNPKKVYESSDILLYIGNANYEVGLARQARENLTRLINLFSQVKEPDIILSKIGDTYAMENNEEKAIKVYELAREKYPDTEGFIASSIGIARYLSNDDKKMEIYLMIKKRFPENKYSRIAMMRMAEIYQKNGEYNKCIQEIEDLLSQHPRGLRYEAVKLMQKAYEQLFKKTIKRK